jgi:energy-coupling factor transporter ATP-binding protein EcfA2
MSAPDEILAFSCTRDLWQQDAIRRLFTLADFTESDLKDALAMLKAQYGLQERAALTPVPLSASHVPQQASDGKRVILNSIGNVVNANRLATGQTLPFAVDGLTVVYGDNGSGKSGYCRILKKLCRVREGGEEDIRGNAFDPASIALPTEATVRFTVGSDELTEVRWKKGSPAPLALARISVFDAKTASLYADQQNKIEFLPHSLDVLTRLGGVCEKLVAILETERNRLEQRITIRLATVSPGTQAAALLDRLAKGTLAQDLPSKKVIEAACAWAAAHAAELEEVERELVSDPETLATKCRSLCRSIATVEGDLQVALSTLNDVAVKRYASLCEAASAAREAAVLAAKQATSRGLLPGFGSDAWRQLFKHARNYSTAAFPGESFPVTREGSRCVLCQQPLSADAVARFASFDSYVRGAAESHAAHEEQARDDAKLAAESARFRSPQDAQALLASLVDEEPDASTVISSIGECLSALSVRHSAVLAAFADGTWGRIGLLPAMPNLQEVRARLTARAVAHDAAKNPDVRGALQKKAGELRDRKTISGVKDSILARRQDLDTLSRIQACKNACETKTLSRKNTDLRKQYLTKDFEERLFREIGQLELGELPFKIQDKSEKGASYLGVGLEAAVKVRNKEVLSDGEFRALAIACFLTEVNSISGHNGIIIDDPVSSLDHQRTRQVARRLVAEAMAGRQVVVFTHDLVFYHELRLAAAHRNVKMLGHWIRRTSDFGFGTIFEGEEPWTAKKVKARLGDLDQKLATLRKASDTSGDAYREKVKSFYTDLRETWERLVEELLLGGVVGRFQLGVETLSLKQVSVTDDDYGRVFFGMKRASEYAGHDRAAGAQATLPGKDEIGEDLADLRAYAEELKKRNEKLEAERKRLERPTRGATR